MILHPLAPQLRPSRLVTLALLAVWAGAPNRAAAEDEAGQPDNRAGMEYYRHLPDMQRLVGLKQHDQLLIGTFDRQGQFVRQRGMPTARNRCQILLMGLLVPIANSSVRAGEDVYETRPGIEQVLVNGKLEMRQRYEQVLVKGKLDQGGKFVPEVGSKVATFNSYSDTFRPDKSLRIYNFPGLFIENKLGADKPWKDLLGRWLEDNDDETKNLADDSPVVFRPKYNLRIEIVRDDVRWRGTLDQRGNFIRDTRFVPEKATLALAGPTANPEFPGPFGQNQIVLGEPPIVPRINSPSGRFLTKDGEGKLYEEVYELRDNVLVQGKLNWDGRFIPEVAVKIVKFERVRKEPYVMRIYNLPGRFVEVKGKAPPAEKKD